MSAREAASFAATVVICTLIMAVLLLPGVESTPTPTPTITVTAPPITLPPSPPVTVTREVRVSRSTPRKVRPVSNKGRPTGLWLALAKCESGANLQRNSGNGYYGAYQFSASTWTGYTHGRFGPVLTATWPEQTYVASRIWQKQGWSAFPGCGRKLGHPSMPRVSAP